MTTEKTPDIKAQGEKTPFLKRARTTARMGVVQALYQMEMTKKDMQTVLREFMDHKAEGLEAGYEIKDMPFFGALLEGVEGHKEKLDEMITGALSKDWTLARLEVIIRCILRAGVYELWQKPDVPMRVIINEYLDISHAFFDASEYNLINGVLDRLGKELRAEEAVKSESPL